MQYAIVADGMAITARTAVRSSLTHFGKKYDVLRQVTGERNRQNSECL